MDFIEIKELIEIHTTTIKAEMKAGNDFLGYKIDEIVKQHFSN